MRNKTIILIPHYNNLSGLKKSVESIFHRTGIDILVIDDGSLDHQKPDLSRLNSSLNNNVALEIIKLHENKGITNALNYGLNYILNNNKHQFIARLDCGDTCVINRFHLQEDFMKKNTDIALVGSWVKWVANNSNEEIFSYCPPSDDRKIKKKMSIRCNIIHPSVMYRVSTVKEIGFYPVHYKAAEDYAYFFEISKHHKIANIPKFLTSAEHNEKGISSQNKKVQNRNKLKIVMKYGQKDLHLLYGVFFNLALILTPSSLVFKIKSQLR